MLLTMSAMPTLAQGQPMDARTEFTFNQPVELPGVTLPPGTYIFRFVDGTTGRKVMQVQAKDASSKTYGMFLTINAQRPRPSDDAELRFLETPAGQPAAVKTWWYPGNTIGREFIYPKSQAIRLAKATNTTVLTTQAENVTNDQMQTADLAYVSPTGQETALTDEQLVAAAANTAPVGTSGTMERSTTSAQTTAADNAAANRARAQEGTVARTRLPKTSTPMAGIGLIGMISLLGGALLRFRA
jgi:ribosomal protein L3